MSSKIRTLALLLVSSIFLTACTLQDLPLIGGLFQDAAPQPANLVIWGLWEDPEVIQPLIDAYQEQNPHVTIDYQDRSGMTLREYKDRIAARASDTGGVDIILMHNTWPKLIPDVLSSAPEDVFTTQEFTDMFYPIAAKDGIVNNNIVAVPAFYEGLALIYNKKHFEEIDQNNPPTGWEEFRRLALELTVRNENGIVRSGAAMGTADNVEFATDIIGLLWEQAGVKYPDQVDGKSAQDAVKFYTNFVLEDEVWNQTMPVSTEAFVNGQVSMLFLPSWRLLDVLSQINNLNDVGVAPVPQVLADNPKGWASYWMYTVAANSQNPDEAWKFIKYLTAEEQQLQYTRNMASKRFFGPVYASPNLASQISNTFIRAYGTYAETSGSELITDRSGNDAQTEALKTVIRDALQKKQANIEESLKKAKESF